MEKIKAHNIVRLPKELSRCPICGNKLTIEAYDCWEKDKLGWYAVEVHLRCESEPDIDSENWDMWYKGHYSKPYIDWQPLHKKILAWLKANYRFKLT
jgi:hypothetical protein